MCARSLVGSGAKGIPRGAVRRYRYCTGKPSVIPKGSNPRPAHSNTPEMTGTLPGIPRRSFDAAGTPTIPIRYRARRRGACRLDQLQGSRRLFSLSATPAGLARSGLSPWRRNLAPLPSTFDKCRQQSSLTQDCSKRGGEPKRCLCRVQGTVVEAERIQLQEIVRRSTTSACKIKRALVLLQTDAGLIDRDVARGLRISAAPVGRIRTRYGPKGLHGALEERLHLHRCIRAATHLSILFRLKWY